VTVEVLPLNAAVGFTATFHYENTAISPRHIGRRDELLDTECGEIVDEESGEVTPLRIVTRQQHGLAPEHVRVIFQVRLYLVFNVVPLGIELIVLRSLGRVPTDITCHEITP